MKKEEQFLLEGAIFLEVRYDWNASETEMRRLSLKLGLII